MPAVNMDSNIKVQYEARYKVQCEVLLLAPYIGLLVLLCKWHQEKIVAILKH